MVTVQSGIAQPKSENVDQCGIGTERPRGHDAGPGRLDGRGDVDMDVEAGREQEWDDDGRVELPEHVGQRRLLHVDIRLDDSDLWPRGGHVVAKRVDRMLAGRVARAVSARDESGRATSAQLHGPSISCSPCRPLGWLRPAVLGDAEVMAGKQARQGFGIDIGGSGIKGAPVDLDAGEFDAERIRIETPDKSTPANVIDIVLDVVSAFDWKAPFGCTFPGIVHHGVIRSAANVDKSWIGVDLAAELGTRTGRRVVVVNDADAAGVAECRYGAAAGVDGVVIVTTLGTGIGSAVFHDGVLLPNTEFGHLELDGKETEKRAAASIREQKGLSWEEWAGRLQRFYTHLEFIFSPDLFVVGGGVSKKADKFIPLLKLGTPIVPAGLLNDAGIIGAALLAAEGSVDKAAST